MRLLKRGDDGELSLTGPYLPSTIPPYAILSHTWGKEEVTFQNFRDGTGRGKKGYEKIKFCTEQANRNGLQYSWVDTCCIDKTNSTELLEAINSMFRWYRDASRCYAYLSDVSITSDGKTLEQYQRPWELAFRQSRWFTRGWTLQELLAPQSVEFFTHDGEPLGNKRDLKEKIHEITNIPIPALLGAPLSEFGVEERLAWVGTRQTTLDEDAAYCLLGIFGVYMPLIYGEGRENAMRRLTKKVNALQNQTVAGENKTLTWQIGPEPLVSHDGYSEAAPALAEFGRDLVAVWRGRNELFGILPNDSLYWATLSRDGDGTPRRGEIKLVHVNAFSRERPAVASLADQLVALWKGVSSEAIYFSTLHDGARDWSNPSPIPFPAACSSTGPALARWEMKGSTRVYALWKGIGDDGNAYLAWYDGKRWDWPRPLPFVHTNANAGLTCRGHEIFVSWKASCADKMYWLRLDMDGNPLSKEPRELGWYGESNLGPALAEVGGAIYAAWKAKGGSSDLWLASWSSEEKGFGPPQLVPNSSTHLAPSLAKWGNSLVLVWRGDDSEKLMWWRNGRMG